MAATTCSDCGGTLDADGECTNPSCEPAAPTAAPKAPAAKAAPPKPVPPAQKWMGAFGGK